MPHRPANLPFTPQTAIALGLLACAVPLLTGGSAACTTMGGDATALDWLPGQADPPPGATLFGRVFTHDGKPVAGAEVKLEGMSPEAPSGKTRTDAKGRYVFKALPPSLVALRVSHPKLGAAGPLPVRLFQGMGLQNAHPAQVDVGGLGEKPRILTTARPGAKTYARKIAVTYKIRRLAPDGRLGMLALAATGVMRLSPARSNAPLVPLAPPLLPRAASLAPGQAHVGGPGAPAADLLLATSAGTAGELSRYRENGSKAWCLELPVAPLDLAISPAGPTWVVGTGNSRDMAILVSAQGKPTATYRLAPGMAQQVAFDRAGSAWLASGAQGIVQVGPTGTVKRRIALPTPVQRVFATPDGGVWAAGGTVATKFDARGRSVARVMWQTPIDTAATDGDGRLWFRDGADLVAADTTGLTRHPIEGKILAEAIEMVSEGRRQLWLLGLDRRTVSIIDLPCDCH